MGAKYILSKFWSDLKLIFVCHDRKLKFSASLWFKISWETSQNFSSFGQLLLIAGHVTNEKCAGMGLNGFQIR